MIVGNVSDKVDAPFRVGLIAQIGLVVNKRRLVFAFGLKRTEQIAVGLVAQTVEPRQFLRAQSDVTARTQQAERDVSLGHGLLSKAGTQLLVGDVECRRHLVAILRFVAASRESDALHHVGIDDGKTFLLTAPDKERAEHFNIINIDRVLVEGTASDIILRRQFGVG